MLWQLLANTIAGQDTIGIGLLRKLNTREMVYVGTWTAALNAADIGGWNLSSTTTGDYVQYTFFGTGFEHRFSNNTTSATWQYTIDGSTNVSGFTTSSYGAGVSSFTASTGTLVTSTSATVGNGVAVSGLSMGLHTVKITKTAGTGTIYHQSFDIITPIHTHKNNLYADLQNTLSVGSNSLLDTRKISEIKEALPAQKVWAQAVGVTSGPSTSSTISAPMPDMSLTVNKRIAGPMEVSFTGAVSGTGSATGAIYFGVDGIIGPLFIDVSAESGIKQALAGSQIYNLGAGFHKIDVYWSVSTSALTCDGTARVLTAKEL